MLAAPSAYAAFPGANGKIALTANDGTDYQIYTINPDGTGTTKLTSNGALQAAWSPDGTKLVFTRLEGLTPLGNAEIDHVYSMNANGTGLTRLTATDGSDSSPHWSPDGQRIVFSRSHEAQCEWDPSAQLYSCVYPSDLFIMNADGSGQTNLTNQSTGCYLDPSWSPRGDRIALSRCGELWLMNPDGSGAARLTSGPQFDSAPDWSPDATRIVFNRKPPPSAGGNFDVFSVRPDGTGLTTVVSGPFDDTHPVWSPDGTRIAYAHGQDEIRTVNPDGTGQASLVATRPSSNPYPQPDWQPIPINTYPRPKGATPLRVPLVPANKACTTPNSTHGAPLSFGSCGPPQLTSGQLTTGTPDSNGLPVRMDAFMELRVGAGDVQIDAHLNDVMNKDLSDYSGSLRAELPLRITDKDNTPSPGGPGAGTTEPFQYGFDIPCIPDPAPTLGSDCSVATTANSLVPGTIKSSLRTIWQIGRVRVDDAGPDGNPDTIADNTVFAVQGVFVP